MVVFTVGNRRRNIEPEIDKHRRNEIMSDNYKIFHFTDLFTCAQNA